VFRVLAVAVFSPPPREADATRSSASPLRTSSSKKIELGGSVGDEVALDIYSVRRAPAMVLAVLVILRLPRPFRKLRGELPVLLELSPFCSGFRSQVIYGR
jgi:hypothetical protein